MDKQNSSYSRALVTIPRSHSDLEQLSIYTGALKDLAKVPCPICTQSLDLNNRHKKNHYHPGGAFKSTKPHPSTSGLSLGVKFEPGSHKHSQHYYLLGEEPGDSFWMAVNCVEEPGEGEAENGSKEEHPNHHLLLQRCYERHVWPEHVEDSQTQKEYTT